MKISYFRSRLIKLSSTSRKVTRKSVTWSAAPLAQLMRVPECRVKEAVGSNPDPITNLKRKNVLAVVNTLCQYRLSGASLDGDVA